MAQSETQHKPNTRHYMPCLEDRRTEVIIQNQREETVNAVGEFLKKNTMSEKLSNLTDDQAKGEMKFWRE